MKDFLIHNHGNMKIKLKVQEEDETNPLANKFYWQYVAYNIRKEKNRRYRKNRALAIGRSRPLKEHG